MFNIQKSKSKNQKKNGGKTMGKAIKNTEQKSIKAKLEESKGITLIALVITIIVLLILAGITIASITGENGILRKNRECSRKK